MPKVAGAIVRNGGPAIQKESSSYVRRNGKVVWPDVAVTGPGELNCAYIVHAVGECKIRSKFMVFRLLTDRLDF